MKQQDSITEQNNNQEWHNSKKVAAYLEVTPQRANALMVHYADLLGKDIKFEGRRKYLNQNGLVRLAFQKNNTGKKTDRTVTVQTAKDKVLEQAKNQDVSKLIELVYKLSQDVNELKQQKQFSQQSHELALELLPASTKEVPEMNLRSALNKYIRDKAKEQNRYYNIVFNELYSQFYYRYNVNIVMRAKKKSMSMIEYAEEYGHLEDLYALARKLYK